MKLMTRHYSMNFVHTPKDIFTVTAIMYAGRERLY